MKKFISICLSVLLVLSLVACGGQNISNKNDKESIIKEDVEPSGEVPYEESQDVTEIVEGATIGVVEGALDVLEENEETTFVETIVDAFVDGVTSVIENQTSESSVSVIEPEIGEDIAYFNAYILEIKDNNILVQPFENSLEFSNSDKIVVHLKEDYKGDDISTFEVGDVLEVVYDGIILESYPAQIYSNEIYFIEHRQDDGEVSITLPSDNSEHIGDFFIEESETIVVKKPVIYLYPETPMNVKVNVSFDGDFVFTYPVAPNGIWDVYAYPNGTLINNKDGREHPYIFWEGTSNINWELSKGFVVKGEDTLSFLEEKLKFLGLNDREISEFISYWVPLMQDNEYNLITFQNELYTDNFDLNVYPTPDSTLRVFMVYKALNNPIFIEEPILTTFDRTGFTVVEWGGAEVK